MRSSSSASSTYENLRVRTKVPKISGRSYLLGGFRGNGSIGIRDNTRVERGRDIGKDIVEARYVR